MGDRDRPAPGAGEEGPPNAPAYKRGQSPFRPAAERDLLQRAVPVAGDLPEYRPQTARRDVLAGVTVAALALPAAMAYAEVAGLSPVHGLYALLLPAVVYALLGSSRQLIVGPEGTLAVLVGAAVLPLAAAGSEHAATLAAMLALLVAAAYGLAWVLRLGWIADYLSRAVIIGYLHGIAIVLVIGQLEKLLGYSGDASKPIGQLVDAVKGFEGWDPATVAVGLVALGILLPMRFLTPRLPAALFVVVGAIVVSWAFDLADRGVAVVGPIPSGLPRLDFPGIPLSDVATLVPAALGIFVVGFADSILTARSFAGRHRQHVRASQELLALGGANAVAGLTQGLAVGASGSRTAVNDQMGARTQVAGAVAAGVIALVLLFLTEPMSYLPTAVLGAVIVSAAIGLVDPEAWRSLARASRFEVVIAAATVAGVLTVGVLPALVIAVGLSIADTVRRSARPHDAVLGWVPRLGRWGNAALHTSAQLAPGVVVYRLDDRLFFANADYVKGRVREAIRGAPYPVHCFVFDAEGMSHIDATGIEALGDIATELAGEGISLRFARMLSHVKARLREAGIAEAIGEGSFHPTVRSAVASCPHAGTNEATTPSSS